MVKHTQAIRLLTLTNCLSVFDHFVGLARKGLIDQISLPGCVYFLRYWTITCIAIICSLATGFEPTIFQSVTT